MHFILSSTRITELARAMAAFRALGGDDTAGVARAHAFDPLLDPARRAIFDTTVRNAFAQVTLALIRDVSVCVLDAEDATGDMPGLAMLPDTPPAMSIDLETPSGLPETASWAIRRALEEAVALLALARLVSSADIPASSGYGPLALAREWESKAAASLATISGLLAPGAAVGGASAGATPYLRPY